MLIKYFLKDNQNTFNAISQAIQDGDIKLAHRLVHTLKGVAATLDLVSLQNAAQTIEQFLAKGKLNFTSAQMDDLEFELNAAIKTLTALTDQRNAKTHLVKKIDPADIYTEKTFALFERLDTLLESNSFDCLTMLEDLESIPGTETLIEKMEIIDFKQARVLLAKLRQDLAHQEPKNI